MSSGLSTALEARRAARTRAEAVLAHAQREHARAKRKALEAQALVDTNPPLEPPRVVEGPATGAALAREAARTRMHVEHRARLRAVASEAQRALLERAAEVERASAALAQALGHERALERAVEGRAEAELRLRERREQAESDEASAATLQRGARPSTPR